MDAKRLRQTMEHAVLAMANDVEKAGGDLPPDRTVDALDRLALLLSAAEGAAMQEGLKAHLDNGPQDSGRPSNLDRPDDAVRLQIETSSGRTGSVQFCVRHLKEGNRIEREICPLEGPVDSLPRSYEPHSLDVDGAAEAVLDAVALMIP